MDQAGGGDRQSLLGDIIAVSEAFEGGEDIAVARDFACTFLTGVQATHGLPVSGRAKGMVQLVVSELVTNALKYAPGPYLLTLEVNGGAVEVTVWDSNPTSPVLLGPDSARIGQHGLEIVRAVGRSFAVHREPVGKRIAAAVVLADGPGADVTGREV